MSHDVFISHSSRDQAIADAIREALKLRGITTWIAHSDVKPSESFAEVIPQAIHEARLVILILSAAAMRSAHVGTEMTLAKNEMTKREMPIAPFRIEDVELTRSFAYHLANVQWMDALEPPMATRIEEFVIVVEQLLRPASVDPPILPPPEHARPHAPALRTSETTQTPPVQRGRKTSIRLRWLALPVVVIAAAYYAVDVSRNRAEARKRAQIARVKDSTDKADSVRLDSLAKLPISITSCWEWPLRDAKVDIKSDGTFRTDGTVVGEWSPIADSLFLLRYPFPQGDLKMSADGQWLKGFDQYGDTITAHREGGGPFNPLSIGGLWVSGRDTLTVRADGSFTFGKSTYQWRPSLKEGMVSTVWPNRNSEIRVALSVNNRTLTVLDANGSRLVGILSNWCRRRDYEEMRRRLIR